MDPQLASNLLVGVAVLLGGWQLVATERANGVAAEPLGDAVLVELEGVGAGLLVSAEALQADGAVLPLARAARRHHRQALQPAGWPRWSKHACCCGDGRPGPADLHTHRRRTRT